MSRPTRLSADSQIVIRSLPPGPERCADCGAYATALVAIDGVVQAVYCARHVRAGFRRHHRAARIRLAQQAAAPEP